MSAERPAATTLYAQVTPGSVLIERFTYEGARGGEGVQWCVHRVEDDGQFTQLIALDTRREAGEFIAGGLRSA